MLSFEPHIIFLMGILLIIGLVLSYFSILRYEILIVFVTFSLLASGFFYQNVPAWNVEEIDYGLKSFFKAGLLVISGILGFIYYIKKFRIHKFKFSPHILLLLLFVVFSFASSLYSIDFKNTFNRAGLLTAFFLFLLGLDTWLDSKKNIDRFMNIIYWLAAIFIIANILSMFTIPGRVWWWKSPSRFIGLTVHPNGLGGWNVVHFPILYFKIYSTKGKDKILPILLTSFNFIIIFATGSRSSLLAAIIGLLIWLIINKDWLKISILGLIMLAGIIILPILKLNSLERAKGSKITDLTERDILWSSAAKFILNKPIIGHGYAVEGKIFDNQKEVDVDEYFFKANAQQPLHNGYLSIFVGGGIIGFFLWYGSFFIVIFQTFRNNLTLYKPLVLATLVPVLIINFVESSLTGYYSATDIYFLIFWVFGGKFLQLET